MILVPAEGQDRPVHANGPAHKVAFHMSGRMWGCGLTDLSDKDAPAAEAKGFS